MTGEVGKTGPIPASILRIEGDPTAWGLRTIGAGDPGWHGAPVVVEIIAPVAGTLILSPTRVGSFTLVPPPLGDGWMPALTLIGPHLYLPSATGLTAAAPGYPLAAEYAGNLTALQDNIVSAMRSPGSTLAVHLNVNGSGVAVLNGPQLSFAVLGTAG
jgi:hypothetical protein